MKTTISAKELRDLNACKIRYKKFVAEHGEKTISLSEALKSNGVNDILWLLKRIELNDQQTKDLRLLAADFAEYFLPFFEKKYPNDDRPRSAIKAARDYANGVISKDELKIACGAAVAADAAYADTEKEWQESKLMSVLKGWEQKIMNNKLRQLRKEAGFTLQNLSDLCGVSKSHLHDLESQTGSAPKLTTAYAIACVLNNSVYDIWPDETQVTEETVVVRRVVLPAK